MPFKPPPARNPLYVDPRGKVWMSWTWLAWLRELVSGFITGDDLEAGTLTATHIQVGSITPEILAGAARSQHGVFMETFEILPADWTDIIGTGAESLEDGGQTGGKIYRAAGLRWKVYPSNIPYDASKLYRIRARVRRTTPGTAGTFFVGVTGYAADGTTKVNTVGADSYYTQHYVCAANVSPTSGVWTDYTGWFKGWSGTPGTTPSTDPTAPKTLHTNVRYFRPLFVANYDAGTETHDIDYIAIDVMDEEAINRIYSGVNTDGTIAANKVVADSILTGEIDATKLSFTPATSVDVIATINASAEGITIEADNIAISGTTTFAAGYDPTGKIATGGAAADVNNNATTISGGKITTGTLDASAITAGTITADRITTGTITVNEMSFVPISPLGFGLPYIFGDASDGDATISSNTNYATGTLKQFNDLTINNGFTLGCSATEYATLFLMVSGTLTVNGTISVNGKGYAGGSGGGNDSGQSGFAGSGATSSYGGSGGGGGNADGGGPGAAGGPTVQTSGAPAGVAGYSISTYRQTSLRFRSDLKDSILGSWGSGGGGGGEDITYDGGAGGYGGGVLIIMADTIVIGATGVISANGANGSQGAAADAGGGGGGGGGTILIVTRSLTNSGSITVTGGTGAAALGSGGAGGNGATGTHILEKIPY